jgi:hypothetical protein
LFRGSFEFELEVELFCTFSLVCRFLPILGFCDSLILDDYF